MAFATWTNRAFLGRAVRYLAGEAGMRQFLDIGTILTRAAQLLDFTKPVAVTLLAILHAIPEADDPHAIVAQLMDAIPSGSYFALSHLGTELLDQDKQNGVRDVADRLIQQMPTYRTREQVARFFDGTDLVLPGLVRVEEWRPEPGTGEAVTSSPWGAAGRKR